MSSVIRTTHFFFFLREHVLTTSPTKIDSMGGKEAKERRRLKRLAQQQAAEAAGADQQKAGADATEKPSTPTSATNRKNNNNEKRSKQNFNNNKQHGRNGPGKNKPKKADAGKKKKKIKKPKHLKRKLEQLSGEDDEGERACLVQQMRQLEDNKALRAQRFEETIKKKAGDKFDQDLFDDLREKGASVNTIMEAVVEKKEQHPNKNKGRKRDNKANNTRKDTGAGSDNVNDMPSKKRKVVSADKKHARVGAESTGNGSDSDSGGSTSIESNEDISDEECDVYILDPEELEKKKSVSNEKNSINTAMKEEEEKGESAESPSDDGSKSSDSSSETDSDSSDDDSDSDVEEQIQERSRGRRRRGRKGADTKREAVNAAVQKEQLEEEQEKKSAEAENTPDKSKKRRCIGRKPVTDFMVGQKYEGEVVYVKSFGAFIDIGCHSDAFVHISRCSDDYVESIEDLLKPGTKVSPRIVEVDRKKKRLTVSLQSEARIADERKSVEDRKDRMKRNNAKKAPTNPINNPAQNYRLFPSTTPPPVLKAEVKEQKPPSQFDDLSSIPESEMTHAQLKRARKLARRAERRKQQDETGLAA